MNCRVDSHPVGSFPSFPKRYLIVLGGVLHLLLIKTDKCILMSSLVGNISIVILRAKPEESPYIATLRYAQSDENGRKFTNPNWTKTDFYWTLFSIFIHPSPEFRPHPLTMGKGNKSPIWEF